MERVKLMELMKLWIRCIYYNDMNNNVVEYYEEYCNKVDKEFIWDSNIIEVICNDLDYINYLIENDNVESYIDTMIEDVESWYDINYNDLCKN